MSLLGIEPPFQLLDLLVGTDRKWAGGRKLKTSVPRAVRGDPISSRGTGRRSGLIALSLLVVAFGGDNTMCNFVISFKAPILFLDCM